MATPRIFVSSTYYDLQEIRFNLKNFISEFGYEAAISEFGDIFYNYESHVQDSCIDEISKCQLFILIIGNNYGSLYYNENKQNNTPDSVTLREFRKALEIKIYKHIFINKYVDYDYKNYKRALEKVILKYFQTNTVSDVDIQNTHQKIKKQFDESYHFPQDSYRYIFYFLDIVYELKEGNAITGFETFYHIKDSLRKQWAGFMYESLTKKEKTNNNATSILNTKLENIEKSISKLIESKTVDKDFKVTFDLSSLTRDANIESINVLQDKIEKLLTEILKRQEDYDSWEGHFVKRMIFEKEFTFSATKTWLDSLKGLVESYKWSKRIHVKNIFKGFPFTKGAYEDDEISYNTILELYTIYNSLSDADKESFVNTVMQRLNGNYEIEAQRKFEPAYSNSPADDDLPF